METLNAHIISDSQLNQQCASSVGKGVIMAGGPEIMSVHMEFLLWMEDILNRGKRLFDQIFKNTVR